MLIPKRPLFFANVLLSLLVAASINPVLTSAQAEPTALIDAAYADLSARLGVAITRLGNTTYTFEQDAFPDSSLGCPQPGLAYSQIVTKGFKILITYPKGSSAVFDYRVSDDGKIIFQCSATGGSVVPTASPVPPSTGTGTNSGSVSGGVPVTLTNPFAFVDSTTGNVTLAHIGDSQSVLLTADSAPPPHIDPFSTTTKDYNHLVWSPDGSKLVFSELQSDTLYASSSGSSPVVISTALKSGYPGAWSPDGSRVAFAVPTNQVGADETLTNQVQAVTITGNTVGAPQYAGTFTEKVGCGGGEIDPAEAHYYEETGYSGNNSVLVWTSRGFVYSLTCVGTGLALADSTGKVLWHVDDVARSSISADRTHAVGTKIDQAGHPVSLELIDLSNGAITPLASEAGVDQAAWSADGTTILYSTLATTQTVKGNASAPAGKTMFGEVWPVDANSWTTTLYRIPATGGASTRLFQQEGRAIGTISAAPDNSGVLFSFVTPFTALIAQINAGAAQAQLNAAEPHAELYYVPWAGNIQAVNLTRGGRPAFGKGTFTVVPAVASAAVAAAPTGAGPLVSPPAFNVAPPNLVIGGHAVVTTTNGDTLNLRQSPGKSAPILGILKPGTVVLIEAGPQNVDGLRWWQVRSSDNRDGWVIDQSTDQDGTTNTLTPQ